MWYLYIILIFICLVLFCKLYIKICYPFWCNQPVYHIYDLFGRFKLNTIISNDLPNINKYVNIIDIKTYKYNELDDTQLNEICDFIRNNYSRKSQIVEYIPKNHNILEYLKASNHPSFINVYIEPNITKKIKNNYYSVMSARPLNVTINNKHLFSTYYVDNLCVIEAMRKKNIANKSIQTFHYNGSRIYSKIKTVLFKRENKLTAIVPLTIFNIKAFDISQISFIKFPHEMYKVIEISSENINIFVEFVNSKKSDLLCTILPDLSNLLSNIKVNNISLYGILLNKQLVCIYVFRDSATYYNKINSIELLASLENCDTNIFVAGFTQALSLVCKKMEAGKVIMDESSANIIICNYLSKIKKTPFLITNGAYYFYNYRTSTIPPSKCFILA
tara:strand:- start:1024 stop:2190 length:1167 start_codon:yes stop_codon:yes gene_type:complete